MIRKAKHHVGKITFWVGWPILYWYLHKTERTRVLIIWEGKALVVRQWLGSGKWSLPGGGLHENEDVIAGAIREVYEETGIVIKPEQITGHGSVHNNEYGFRFVCHQLSVELQDCPEIHIDGHEIQSAKWLNINNLSDENIDQMVYMMCTSWLQSSRFGKI